MPITTSTDMANEALRLIGSNSIDSIDDEKAEARTCKAIYDDSRKYYIRLANPTFARKEIALALASGETSSIYDKVYSYPSDCMIGREIFNPAGRNDMIAWQRGAHNSLDSSVVRTDQVGAVFIYSVDITNLVAWPDDAKNALAYYMAMKLASSPIKRDASKEQEMKANFLGSLEIARANDKLEENFEFYTKKTFDPDALTPTDIANKSLRNIAVPMIDSITDKTSEAAIHCSEEYQDAIYDYLKTAEPGFAIEETALVDSGETSIGYDFVYEYPSDCLKVVEVYNPNSTTERITYRRGINDAGDARTILTDLEDAEIRYVKAILDLSLFSADDIKAVSFLLASRVGLAVPKDRDVALRAQLVTKAEINYHIAKDEAMLNDKREQHLELKENDIFITSRR